MKKFRLTPLQASKAKHIDRRKPHSIKIIWDVKPKRGRKFGHWRLLKRHIEWTLKLMSVMSSDELYNIKTAIKDGHVPEFYLVYIDIFYNSRTQSSPITDIVIQNIELFDFEDKEELNNLKEKFVPQTNTITANVPGIDTSKLFSPIPNIKIE
jgi:hypothetical protein